MKTHVWIEDPCDDGEHRHLSAVLERPDGERNTIWFRVPLEYADKLSTRADAFTVISLFTAMRLRSPLHIHGEVSPSLLRNLEEYQAIWSTWAPEQFSMVEISADVERERAVSSVPDQAIVAFSGGVDAVFTAYRHRQKLCGRRARVIGAGVMIHGYDIPPDDDAMFTAAYTRARAMSDALDFPLIPVTTNYRQLESRWEEVHLACVASCLMLFEGSYNAGLVGSSDSYAEPVLPWASTPMSDPLLSSGSFPIVHDGAEYNRVGKLEILSRWEPANDSLFVCWEPTPDGRNCCRCKKCIRTILNYRAMGLGLPKTFERDIDDTQIATMRNMREITDFEDLLKLAHKNHVTGTWIPVLERVIHTYKFRSMLGKQELVVTLRNRLNRNPVGRRLWSLVGRK